MFPDALVSGYYLGGTVSRTVVPLGLLPRVGQYQQTQDITPKKPARGSDTAESHQNQIALKSVGKAAWIVFFFEDSKVKIGKGIFPVESQNMTETSSRIVRFDGYDDPFLFTVSMVRTQRCDLGYGMVTIPDLA